jgi:ankyrin repeat protein
MHSKYRFLFTILFVGFGLQAQNVFLDRAYWKASPDVANVATDIQNGNDPSESNSNAFDATVYAIIENAPDATVKYLLDQKGNDVNKITHDGRTYIFWAAYKGNTNLMQYLQKKGAKTNLVESHGYTIMNFAAATGQTDTKVYDLCLQYGANLKKDVDHDGANALLLAAMSAKDLSLIDYFTAKGLDLKSKDAHGNGLPDYAAKSGNIKVLETLTDKGLAFGSNAMVMAAQGTRSNTNTLETYRFLESKGVRPNATDANGGNALHFIVRKEKQNDVIEYFLAKGVDVNQADKDGNTVLMNAAASNNDPGIVKTLLAKVKDVNATNAKGQSALALAVQGNSPEIVALLIEKGADAKVTDKDGNSLTYYLAQSFDIRKSADFDAKLKSLQSKGFDLATPQKNGNTLYHMGVVKNDRALLKKATDFKIDINHKNAEGLTALHKAAMTARNDETLKYLLSIGAKTNEKTDMNETAYDLALENEALAQNKTALDFLK